MRRIPTTVVCLALTLLSWHGPFSADSLAHSLYIQSSRYEVYKGKSSPVFFCYGHHVPVDDGVRASKLNTLRVTAPDGSTRDLEPNPETGLQSHMVEYDRKGTWALSAWTNPGTYTVYVDKKGRERHTIKPKSAVRDEAQEIVKSLYSRQYTKTYVVCEEPSPEFPARLGLELELAPARDVTSLRPGDDLELRVWFHGEPYDGPGSWDATYAGFSSQAEDNFHMRTEVEGGSFTVPLPNAGRWFVRYFVKVPAQGEEAERFTHAKYTATLVFEVPNERIRPKADGH